MLLFGISAIEWFLSERSRKTKKIYGSIFSRRGDIIDTNSPSRCHLQWFCGRVGLNCELTLLWQFGPRERQKTQRETRETWRHSSLGWLVNDLGHTQLTIYCNFSRVNCLFRWRDSLARVSLTECKCWLISGTRRKSKSNLIPYPPYGVYLHT